MAQFLMKGCRGKKLKAKSEKKLMSYTFSCIFLQFSTASAAALVRIDRFRL